ncbi:MAG: alpha/beta fold hydrolase [Victivallales bacterium]|nr:alpha/beta fold hydrolase [Victivallales bacterium]
MPIVEKSSYKTPVFFWNAHLQTIYPSYARKLEKVNYEREIFTAPDKMKFYLDWSKTGSDKLVIVSHGLCGNTNRHYVLSTVKTFNGVGWDVLAWNYRGTGPTPLEDASSMTTSNSTDHLAWVLEHAILSGHYKKVVLMGFSMGGDLNLMYLSREASSVPNEMLGSVSFCATIDVNASSRCFDSFMGNVYFKYFIKKLKKIVIDADKATPGSVKNMDRLEGVSNILEYDDLFMAPLAGFRNAEDYWTTTSAWRWLDRLQVPSLIVNPKNDPFLAGKCYPVEEARQNDALFLEMPDGGGHCGFFNYGDVEWWPMRRAKEFVGGLK